MKIFKKVMALIAVLGSISGAAYAEKSVHIKQIGDFNAVFVEQSAESDWVRIIQQGNGNDANVVQSFPHTVSEINQRGSGNEAHVTQSSDAQAVVNQQGTGNIAIIHQ